MGQIRKNAGILDPKSAIFHSIQTF